MAGYTERLQKKVASVVDEKSYGYIAMILDPAKRMGDLIDDLLAFARIGRSETQKTSVNLAQLVKEVLSEVRQDAAGPNTGKSEHSRFLWRSFDAEARIR